MAVRVAAARAVEERMEVRVEGVLVAAPPNESWCPLQEETGWSLVLSTAQFTPAADFAAVPEELGRGWLKKPPVWLEKLQPLSLSLTLILSLSLSLA